MKKKYEYHPIAQPTTIGLSICLTVLLSIFSHTVYYLAVCLLHLILVAYSHYFARKCKIQWELKQKQVYLFTEEQTDCSISFQNISSFPVYEMSFHFSSDDALLWEYERFNSKQYNKNYYVLPFSMQSQVDMTFTFKTHALKRGKYTWRNACLIVKDPLRLISIYFYNQNLPVFLVYPNMRKVHLPESKEYQGTRKALVSPLFDETKLIGVKRYESEDFRSIHWGATAKSGELMAKKYDFTQTDRYAVIVNLADRQGFSFHQQSEDFIQIAIGVCKQLIQQNCSYELWINRVTPNGLTHIPLNKNRKQLQTTLELFSLIQDGEAPISTYYFYRNVFRKKKPDSIPLIIGFPPIEMTRKNQCIQITS
jgi:uncharacterized protein (DUF58 family)